MNSVSRPASPADCGLRIVRIADGSAHRRSCIKMPGTYHESRRRLGAADRVHQGREPAEARARRRGRGPRLRPASSARTKRTGASSRCCTTSTTSGGRRSDDHPFRGVEILRGAGYPEWVTRAILSHADYQRRAARQPAREDAVRLRRDGRLRHRRVARPAEQEHARSRGVVGDQADEGQGVRRARSSATICTRGAELLGLPLDEHITQRDRVHARAGRRARPARHAVTRTFRPPSVYQLHG